jgi:hypothetical protein
VPSDRLKIARDCYDAYESGDRALVEQHLSDAKTDGKRFRKTEILTFEGDKIARAEVYFGWDLE